MDKKITENRWTLKRIGLRVGVPVLVVLVIVGFRLIGKKVYVIEAEKVKTAKVIYADFKDEVLINGTIEPITTVFVNATEGGTVAEVFVEDGAFVEKGRPLLKLSNPTVLLQYMTQETAIVEQVNNLRNIKLELDKNQRQLKEDLLDMEYNLAEVKRKFKVDTVLFMREAIARNEFLKTNENYRYQVKKKALLENTVKKESNDYHVQISQINASIDLMQRNLSVIRDNIEGLTVKAPISGRLSSFNPVIGKSFSRGESLGKISVQHGYLVRSEVDQYYVTAVKPGQVGTFNFNGKDVLLEVKKVLPEVVNGKFQIDFKFLEGEPEKLRQGQNLQIRLALAATQKSLIIPKGSYYHSTGGRWVYVVNELGEGTKRNISIGKQNPDCYQVISGVEEGEVIITSSYDHYKNNEFLKITDK